LEGSLRGEENAASGPGKSSLGRSRLGRRRKRRKARWTGGVTGENLPAPEDRKGEAPGKFAGVKRDRQDPSQIFYRGKKKVRAKKKKQKNDF